MSDRIIKIKQKLQRSSLIESMSKLFVFYRRKEITKQQFIDYMISEMQEKL